VELDKVGLALRVHQLERVRRVAVEETVAVGGSAVREEDRELQ